MCTHNTWEEDENDDDDEKCLIVKPEKCIYYGIMTIFGISLQIPLNIAVLFF